ncbi:MAG: PhzF family phenazine biosynthesis protein [Pseudomonadota bacterium]
MTKHGLIWVDAFTDRRFGGNPCAVVFAADPISTKDRIAFTRETRLSECAFVQRSETADFGARYYTASGEIKMAGHPTVATVTALIQSGLVKTPSDVTLEVGAGVLPISVDIDEDGGPDFIEMTQPKPRFGSEHEPAKIAGLYGIEASDIVDAPQTVDIGGTKFCVTLLRTHEALRRAALDAPALLAMRKRPDCDFAEPFLATTQGVTKEGDTFSRLLLPPPEPPEDPFTGSATGCLAAYLWARGHLERPRFRAEQGHWMERPGVAQVAIDGPRDKIEGIRVAGQGVVVMRGEISF